MLISIPVLATTSGRFRNLSRIGAGGLLFQEIKVVWEDGRAFWTIGCTTISTKDLRRALRRSLISYRWAALALSPMATGEDVKRHAWLGRYVLRIMEILEDRRVTEFDVKILADAEVTAPDTSILQETLEDLEAIRDRAGRSHARIRMRMNH